MWLSACTEWRGWLPPNYLKGSPPLSKSTMPSPPPVLGDPLSGLTGLLSLTPACCCCCCCCCWAGPFLSPLLDLASNNFTVSLTLDLGRGGSTGLMGDLRAGLDLLCWPADTARRGDLDARTDNLSSSLLGNDIGLGILDLPDLLDLPLSLLASLPGVVAPVLGSHDPCKYRW